nr:helical backbone metal receptor [uncultured Cohaesibacter sp.]
MQNSSLRVVSLVPSWTETLLAADIVPVGRTRFCIHPSSEVEKIPVVAGTKDWNWEKLLAAKPDLILLDREENARFMAEQTDIPVFVSHVTSLDDMASTLADLSARLCSDKLSAMAERCRSLLDQRLAAWHPGMRLPALMGWGREPKHPISNILYLIWRKPWMAVSRDSFIGDSLARLGIEITQFDEKYPQIDLARFDPEKTLLLCSSEPYPFHLKKKLLAELPFAHAIVDGELLSWYGIRNLQFMEQELIC